MLKSYLTLALKTLARNRLYSLINIAGLSVGLTSCLIIALYVQNELSFDTHYLNADRIFRVYSEQTSPSGDQIAFPNLSAAAGPLLKQDVAGIEEVARVSKLPGQAMLSRDELRFNETDIYSADSSIFTLFDFQWLSGSPGTALNDQSSIVLTRSLAEKYFGNEDAVGQLITVDNQYSLRVTGVIEDMADDTHLQFAAIVPLSLLETILRTQSIDILDWRFKSFSTYLLTEKGADLDGIRTGLAGFVENRVPEDQREPLNIMSLADVHMQLAEEVSGVPGGSMVQVLSFTAIGVGILMVAIINFVNLATSISSRRAVEIGMRKAIGAGRRQIVTQFLLESLLMVAFSLLLALVFTELLLPVINGVIGKELSFSNLLTFRAVLLLTGFTLVLGILAGCYPAFYLSAFNPVTVLRGTLTRGKAGAALRNVLVIMQFAVAITLIVATAVITAQMRFSREVDLGFNEDQIVEVPLPPPNEFDIARYWQTMRAQLLSGPGIVSVTHGLTSPLRKRGALSSSITREGSDEDIRTGYMMIDSDFFDVFEIPLLAGRYLSSERAGDSMAFFNPEQPDALLGNVILNELAARRLGWSPDEAIGREVGLGPNGSRGFVRVAGVVGNTIESVKSDAGPIIYVDPEGDGIFFFGSVSIRIAGGDIPAALAHIDRTWNSLIPDKVIDRQFLDDQVAALYQEERRQMDLLFWFSVLAVSIACLGLFGLVTQNTESRTKEIGVRKVMGSSVWEIILLFTNSISRLVLLSNLIAWPVAYYAMQRWLENFVYRIDLTPLVFLGSGAIVLCIAWVTVGSTAARAASRKPALALRYE